MAPTMILGRVVLPLVGLGVAAVLIGQYALSVARPATPSAAAPGERAAGPRPAAGMIVAEGRVVAAPGARVVVGAEVAGTLLVMPVGEKSAVRKGDLLAEFKADEARAAVREAAALLAGAEADLLRAQRDGSDANPPGPRGIAGLLDRDASRREVGSARARRDAAKAALDRLKAAEARYRILAPRDGVVIARHVEPGETVDAAAPLLTIVDLAQLRIEAEVDEFDIPRVAPGAAATITAEGYPDPPWPGTVSEVADAVVPRRTRPEDPARPTDTGVLPVKITPRGPIPLKLGQRVEVRIAVLAATGPR